MPAKISVIGGGSWATAISKILSDNGHEVYWWLRKQETVDYVRQFRHNPSYLSMVEFDLPAEQISNDLKWVISQSDWIVFAVPSYYFPDMMKELSPEDLKGKNIVSAIKGIVQEGHLLISQYLNKAFEVSLDRITNVSGPCHAEEVASEKLSYLTFASPNTEMAKELAGIFANRFVNTHWSADLQGTEYAAVLKNVYALATGITVGLGYGDNFRAVLVSKAMQEMQYFLKDVLQGDRDVLNSPYLGDTLVTCYSQHSRNRTFGLMIGRGYSVNAAKLELNMVAEGYYSTNALKKIADEHKLQMPILNAVYHILYDKIAPSIEMHLLSEKLD